MKIVKLSISNFNCLELQCVSSLTDIQGKVGVDV